MILVGVGIWAGVAVTCLVLVLTHRGAWPYTKGGYASERGRLLRRFWIAVVLTSMLWPLIIVWAGTKVLIEELT